jgi:hypothetical protein
MPPKKKPSKSWCWWCCHDFSNIPLSLPIEYNSKTTQFTTFGNFCSFECMKAYNHYENVSQKNNQYMLISLMYSKSNTSSPFACVGCAPPRQCLKEFGGDMTIETFREISRKGVVYDIQIPPIIKADYVIDKQQSNWVMRSDTNNKTTDTVLDTTVSKVKNNAIKIRSNPKKMTTLDAVFGITTAEES